jgi:replicative DNA helicase
MAINLSKCTQDCHSCIKAYAKKHRLRKGDSFDITCNGIPENYVSEATAAQLQSPFSAELLLDPVKWAAEVLDWHCIDPDGEVWKRKDPEEYASMMERYPGRPSKYHRPQQAVMLRCSAKRKVFRIGRQFGKTETLVISMLFAMFTHQGFKIVLITPYQSQIDLIFKRLQELVENNPTLQNSVKRSVKAPQYTLELYNNSQIKGFTAGTKSGSGAAAARGQSANMLVFDEADYLDPADMDAAMSIITNYPDATVWMSSTPSGKRDKFYEVCNSKDWKEYHFPSYMNPNWNDELERTFRSVLTEIGYKHEVLGEFGEQEEGVFQVPYVEAGVDWNSPTIGTTICVTGFDPASQKFRVVERQIVQRAGWTQLDACHAIAMMNRKWRPFAIYVDKGYGATQIEVLHKYGYDARMDSERGKQHIDAKLPRIVKAYDFGSSIETRDPFTGQKLKKPAKGFLVESSVRRFEAGDIQFPETDEVLKAELLNYIVKNVTVTGQFVYGVNNEAIGDHNLDALMLSLVAFTLEKTSFGKPILNETINFSDLDHGEEDGETWVPVGDERAPTRKEMIQRQHPSSERHDLRRVNSERLRPWSRPGWESDREQQELVRLQRRNNAGRNKGRAIPSRGRSGSGGRNKF